MSQRLLSPFTVACFAFVACLMAFGSEASCQAQVGDPGSFKIESFTDEQFELYERQLNALLKTRRDEEKAYVKAIVGLVKAGKLSPKIVQTSYGWVRNKRPFTKYPFVFFEQVLRRQAQKASLDDIIPTFDYGIYSRIVTTPVR